MLRLMLRPRRACWVRTRGDPGERASERSCPIGRIKCANNGIKGLTRSLALELGSANIRVNAIVPGYIETAMTEGKALSLFQRCNSCAVSINKLLIVQPKA